MKTKTLKTTHALNLGAENVGPENERLRYFVVSVVHTMFIYGTTHCGCLFSAEPWS